MRRGQLLSTTGCTPSHQVFKKPRDALHNQVGGPGGHAIRNALLSTIDSGEGLGHGPSGLVFLLQWPMAPCCVDSVESSQPTYRGTAGPSPGRDAPHALRPNDLVSRRIADHNPLASSSDTRIPLSPARGPRRASGIQRRNECRAPERSDHAVRWLSGFSERRPQLVRSRTARGPPGGSARLRLARSVVGALPLGRAAAREPTHRAANTPHLAWGLPRGAACLGARPRFSPCPRGHHAGSGVYPQTRWQMVTRMPLAQQVATG